MSGEAFFKMCGSGNDFVFLDVMMRTPRGRVATSSAYLHFGLTPPASQERQRQRDLELFGRAED